MSFFSIESCPACLGTRDGNYLVIVGSLATPGKCLVCFWGEISILHENPKGGG